MQQHQVVKELARRGVRIGNTLVSKWENDERRPDAVAIIMLADVYDVRARDLGATATEYPELEVLGKVAATRRYPSAKLTSLPNRGRKSRRPRPPASVQSPLVAPVG